MQATKLVIGVDEAGYGPSMGPLAICATAWRVPFDFQVESMSKLLEPEFLAKPIKLGSSHVPIGDSKKINKDRFGKQGLCLGSAFQWCELKGDLSLDWNTVLADLAKQDWERLQRVAWYAVDPSASPQSTQDEQLKLIVADTAAYFANASAKLRSLSTQLVGIQMRVLDEPEFNRQVDIIGNKSSLLSETSLKLVRDVIVGFVQPHEQVEVYCDKHGGRNRYQSILSHCFDQELFSILLEGAECSRYTTCWNGNAMHIQFKVDGDSIFPSAAASILAKWTREVLMGRLNTFWKSKIVGRIEPTAGYYVDAMRFAGQIESVATAMGLERSLWWRKK
jgi:ribonuclease HII